jgi:hypothetical protein
MKALLIKCILLLDTVFSYGQIIIDSMNLKKPLSFQINAAFISKAKITQTEGANYKLKSRLQSSFDGGFNIEWQKKNSLSFQTGIHFCVSNINYYFRKPGIDTDGYPFAPTVELKQVYYKIKAPFLIIKKWSFRKKSFLDIRPGIILNFAFEGFEDISQGAVFSNKINSDNNGKPWISFYTAFSKNHILKNKNLLNIGLFIDYSPFKYFTSTYTMDIPGYGYTKGTYSVTGSGLGITFIYQWTGYNKKVVTKYYEE